MSQMVSPHLDREPLLLLTVVMAWAVRHEVPLVEALRAVPGQQYRRLIVDQTTILPAGRPKSDYSIGRMCVRYPLEKSIARVTENLERGSSLADALQKGMRPRLPGYYLTALAEAETQGTLPEVLPVLANQLERACSAGTIVSSIVAYLGAQLTVAAAIIMGLVLFILPRFAAMVVELGMADGAPMVAGTAMAVLGYATAAVPIFASVLIAVCLISAVLVRTRFRDVLLLPIPFLGRITRTCRRLDLAQSMGVCLASGKDVVAAAAWSRTASRSLWVRWHLGKFLQRVESGEPWWQAWNAICAGPGLERWLVASSAAQEQPQIGFNAMVDHYHARLQAMYRRLQQFGTAASSVLMAALVAPVVLGLFGCLVELINIYANWGFS